MTADPGVPGGPPSAADLGAALRLMRRPGWAFGLLAVVVLSVAFVRLGEWQHARYEAKVERNRWIDANYTAAPVPLDDLLPGSGAPLRPEVQWRPATVTGHYEAVTQQLLRNRALGNAAGFEVLVPLRLADGSALLIDRGWVPTGRTGGVPDAVPAPPPGPVTLVVRLRPGEGSDPRTSPPGQQYRVDLARLADVVGGPLRQGYGVLAEESPRPDPAPTLIPHPDEDLGPHLGYAWQWWVFAVAGYGLFGHYLLRDARRSRGVGPITWSPRRPRAPRGPTDEEWEDAATEDPSRGSRSPAPRR